MKAVTLKNKLVKELVKIAGVAGGSTVCIGISGKKTATGIAGQMICSNGRLSVNKIFETVGVPEEDFSEGEIYMKAMLDASSFCMRASNLTQYNSDIVLKESNGQFFMEVPDVATVPMDSVSADEVEKAVDIPVAEQMAKVNMAVNELSRTLTRNFVDKNSVTARINFDNNTIDLGSVLDGNVFIKSCMPMGHKVVSEENFNEAVGRKGQSKDAYKIVFSPDSIIAMKSLIGIISESKDDSASKLLTLSIAKQRAQIAAKNEKITITFFLDSAENRFKYWPYVDQPEAKFGAAVKTTAQVSISEIVKHIDLAMVVNGGKNCTICIEADENVTVTSPEAKLTSFRAVAKGTVTGEPVNVYLNAGRLKNVIGKVGKDVSIQIIPTGENGIPIPVLLKNPDPANAYMSSEIVCIPQVDKKSAEEANEKEETDTKETE